MGVYDLDGKIIQAADLIVHTRNVVVFTGAGVSTESGIPDFRSPGGIWTKFDPEDFTIQKFLSSPETRKKQWQMLLDGGLFANAQPNRAHLAVAMLEEIGKLNCVITQNVDNLHQKAGNSPEKVYELHGNMRWLKCMSCDARYPVGDVTDRFRAKKEVPRLRTLPRDFKAGCSFLWRTPARMDIKKCDCSCHQMRAHDCHRVVSCRVPGCVHAHVC